MKLTKLQRYTAYCIMLAEGDDYRKYVLMDGLCWVIYEQMGIENSAKNGFIDKVIHENFPELLQIWVGVYDKHFNNWNERAAALKQCIAETAPK